MTKKSRFRSSGARNGPRLLLPTSLLQVGGGALMGSFTPSLGTVRTSKDDKND